MPGAVITGAHLMLVMKMLDEGAEGPPALVAHHRILVTIEHTEATEPIGVADPQCSSLSKTPARLTCPSQVRSRVPRETSWEIVPRVTPRMSAA
jgi:hypothetical protein